MRRKGDESLADPDTPLPPEVALPPPTLVVPFEKTLALPLYFDATAFAASSRRELSTETSRDGRDELPRSRGVRRDKAANTAAP